MDILPNFLNLWSKIHSEKLNWSAFIAHMDKQSFYQSSPKWHRNDMYKRTDLSVGDGQNNWQTSVNNMKFVNWHLVVLSNDYKLPIFWAYHDMLWEMSCFVSLFSSRDFIITVMYRILIDESRTAVYDEV